MDHQLDLRLPLQELRIEHRGEEEAEEKEKSSSWDNLVEEIKGIIGYEFRNPSLLREAFTDNSYLDEDKTSTASYERLEYMGDAVLGFFMAKEHFAMYPDLAPGQLTKLRAANVDNEKLARVALKYGLHTFLRHKKPLLAGQIKEFEEAIVEYPVHSSGLVDAPKALADIVESLVGAVYVDSNSMDTTCKIIQNLLQPMITPSTLQTHPVTMLYEICQKNKVKLESRDLWKETGEIEFIVDDEFVGRAKYTAKRVVANNRAANEAYHKILRKLRLQNTRHDHD
ncbi:Ribonuclease 3-like protein 3 [Sesamum alatum]|uniref:Ribonuclease 3-like protein 3 n=1 Tax=Sesamum alatum TaxID=300844 RepID=A0AAE2CP55_9LAMI|nr:Ribonuclease 3-like protein 3 [Sesamum alatum]